MTTRQNSQDNPPLFGLVLAGGESVRMGRDKASLDYHGEPQAQRCFRMLGNCCEKVYLSLAANSPRQDWMDEQTILDDSYDRIGPMGGILTALESHSTAGWLVMACDIPLVTVETIQHLCLQRDSESHVTAYRSDDGRAEPLLAIYEAKGVEDMRQRVRSENYRLRDFIEANLAHMLSPNDPEGLVNVNTIEEHDRVTVKLHESEKD